MSSRSFPFARPSTTPSRSAFEAKPELEWM
jgi:hypothetical protein